MGAANLQADGARRGITSLFAVHAEGLLGYLVKTRGLGIAVDCRNAAALAAAVREISDPDATGRYAEALRRFVDEHSAERFAAAVREPFDGT